MQPLISNGGRSRQPGTPPDIDSPAIILEKRFLAWTPLIEYMRYYPDPAEDLDPAEVNAAIEAAFAEHGRGRVQMPPKIYIHFDHGDFRTMPAYLPSLEIAGVKIVNVHPDNPARKLPTVMALTIILDINTGMPEAILNATGLTDLRTGAAGAVAAKYLSPKRNVTMGLAGSGRQALAQVRATSRELNLERILVWSRNEQNAESFCKKIPELDCCSAPLSKVCDSDLLVTTTPSRAPYIRSEWIHEGTHINAIGADGPGKEELDPAILTRARVFVDDPAQAVHSGEINVPVRSGLFQTGMIAGTLGEVVLGQKRRTGPDEITIFDSTGLAIQDLALAKIAMKDRNFITLQFP